MGDIRSDVDRVFAPDGTLVRTAGWEHRPQQSAMAGLVASSLEEGVHRVIEAPTGVGKSLAYLVPSLLFALDRGGRCVVSTHTRNLQDQLIGRDIPLARRLTGRRTRAAVLKGRRNYLCTTRLAHAVASSASLFADADTAVLGHLQEWARSTSDGELEGVPFSLPPAIWNAVCSERDLCGPPHCGPDCFYQRARERARTAHLLVLNHALLFTLMGRDGGGLPERTLALVLDEAHMLEPAATSALGSTLELGGLTGAIHRLYNPKTRRGLLARTRGVRTTCAAAAAEAREFFAAAARLLPPGAYTIPAPPARLFPRPLVLELERLAATATGAAHAAGEEQQTRELERAAADIAGAAALLAFFSDEPDPGRAVWLEADPGTPAMPAFRSAPVDVAPLAGPLLFGGERPAILTGATLAVGGRFETFTARIGAGGVHCDALDSPFDFPRVMTIVLARGIPEPDDRRYAAALPHWIGLCIRRSRGRALVLFTNATLMRATAVALRAPLEAEGITLLVQGEGRNRNALLEEFRNNVGSVLLGLESFWSGVDVPGPALEHVVITRLPFAVPDHPLTAARTRGIAARGGNPFAEYLLPEAILRLRQGAGRLIRTADDRGVVSILDARMLTRSYGPAILASLPRCPIEVMDEAGETEILPREEW